MVPSAALVDKSSVQMVSFGQRRPVMERRRMSCLLCLPAFLLLGGCATVQTKPKAPWSAIPYEVDTEVRAGIKDLYSSSPARRAEGALSLAKMGEKAAPAVPFLIDLLGDSSMPSLVVGPSTGEPVTVGGAAAVALASIGAPAVPALIVATKAPAPYARANAAFALGKIGDRQAVGPLIELLADRDAAVRGWALTSLVAITGRNFGFSQEEWKKWHDAGAR